MTRKRQDAPPLDFSTLTVTTVDFTPYHNGKSMRATRRCGVLRKTSRPRGPRRTSSRMSIAQLQTAFTAYRVKHPEWTGQEYREQVGSFLRYSAARKRERRWGQVVNPPYVGRFIDGTSTSGINTLECPTCGHTETWETGNYFGERTDFTHHDCGEPGRYKMCSPDCGHLFPGCANIAEHSSYGERANTSRYITRTGVAWNALEASNSEAHRASTA